MTHQSLTGRRLFAVGLGLVALILPAHGVGAAEPSAWTLESALKQLDKSSQDFRTAVTDVELTAVDTAGAAVADAADGPDSRQRGNRDGPPRERSAADFPVA